MLVGYVGRHAVSTNLVMLVGYVGRHTARDELGCLRNVHFVLLTGGRCLPTPRGTTGERKDDVMLRTSIKYHSSIV